MPDDIQAAFTKGAADVAAAQSDMDKNRKDDAVKEWSEAADYFGAVSGKFTGVNRITALRDQAHAQEKMVDCQVQPTDVHDYSAAMHTLRTARQESESVDPALHADVETEYNNLISLMDRENSKTLQYKIMDGMVRLLGNNTAVSPILAVMLIAVVVTLVTWPLRVKSAKSAKELARYQPELKKLQDKYKGDAQALWTAQQEFNKKHGINQFAGCLPALMQWPIVVVMYRLILGYQYHFSLTTFLWINPKAAEATAHLLPFPLIGHNLGEQDVILLALYAVSMFVQTKLTPVTSSDPAVVEQQKMMATFMPAIFFVMMLQAQLPSAFVLYWFSSNVLFVGQQWLINRSLPTLPPLVLDADDDGASAESRVLKANPKLIAPASKQRKK